MVIFLQDLSCQTEPECAELRVKLYGFHSELERKVDFILETAVDNSLYNYLNAEKETAAAFNTPRSRIVAITISIKMITILENM